MTLVLQWRAAPPPLTLEWRGPQGMLPALQQNPMRSIAGFLVPPALPPAPEDPGDIAAIFLSA